MGITLKVGKKIVLDGIGRHEGNDDGDFMDIVDFIGNIVTVHFLLEELEGVHVAIHPEFNTL